MPENEALKQNSLLQKEKTEQHSRLSGWLQMALLAAILSVFSQISIPLPGGVPMTLQTFALAFIAYWAGSSQAFRAVVLYLLMGALGLPVFAGFKGGFQCFLGPTSGFLLGFAAMALVIGLSRLRPSRTLGIVCGLAGLACCHAMGLCGLMLVLKLSPARAFMVGSLPFLAKDVLSAAAAWAAVRQLDKRLCFESLKQLALRF